jgi:NDP-sugar pyrophosphorylase family protein
MKAMILAAGLGTRLRPLTDTVPKALVPVNGEPLITYSLKLLKKQGVTEVLINLHYLGDLIEKELGDGRKFGMKISYSQEPTVLGTGGGIKKGKNFFGKDPFFVLNSDVLIDLDLKKFLEFHQKKKGIATMTVRPREADSQETAVFLGTDDRIRSIGGEGKKEERAVMYTGIQILEPEFLKYLPENGCLIRQGYQPALADGQKVFGFLYEGYWNDLGTLERYRQAERDLTSGKIKLSYL